MSPNPLVDLVLVFRAVTTTTLSKQDASREIEDAVSEYSRLLTSLKDSGLKATGRRGASDGQLLVFIYAPWEKMQELVQAERHSDFLLGLPSSSLPSHVRDYDKDPMSASERLRLVHGYVTAARSETGLGIVPDAEEWPRLQSILSLHDHEFNDLWMHTWTYRQFGFGFGYKELYKVKDQFGEAVALYFAFLSSYTKFLVLPAAIGAFCFFRGISYDPIYSIIVVLWSITFVEWWRIRERILSIRWGSYGSFRVEKRRPKFRGDASTLNTSNSGKDKDSFPWWKRESRIVASIPVIILFGSILILLLTCIFVFEAFVTQIYTGPGLRAISFSPTVLFIALIPRLMSLYRYSAVTMTNWENHWHQSTYDYSLTIKTFALSSLVSYSGLALSAFIYVPFHEQVMTVVHHALFSSATENIGKGGLFEANLYLARAKVNPSRLQDQMFAFTVTNQIISFGLEVILPFVMRKAGSVKANGIYSNGKKENTQSHDKSINIGEETEFLERVRFEAALPEFSLFDEYTEMVTQFGYVAAWSTIWPLAPLMAFLNNWFEIRGDAFKIVKHCRRPLPQRADTIGAWMSALGFIAWLSALTNSAMVYLFEPSAIQFASIFGGNRTGTALDEQLSTNSTLANRSGESGSCTANCQWNSVFVPSLLIALSSSHGYLLVRVGVRHILERMIWKGSVEQKKASSADHQVKRLYLHDLDSRSPGTKLPPPEDVNRRRKAFWGRDDGIEELKHAMKQE